MKKRGKITLKEWILHIWYWLKHFPKFHETGHKFYPYFEDDDNFYWSCIACGRKEKAKIKDWSV